MAQETQKIWSLYRITNKINDKVYIGQAQDYQHRWSDHRLAVKKNKPTQVIHHAMIKHGIDNFEFEVIASCQNQDDANYLETELVKQYNSFVADGYGYNATLGGMNAPKSEKWKRHMSEVMTGKPGTYGHLGKVHTDESKQVMSQTKIEQYASGEVVVWNKGLNVSGMSGKHQSDHQKQMMREWNETHPKSEETKQKISDTLKGRPIKGRITSGHLGKKHSDEAKRKMSEAAKARHSKNKT